MAQAELRAVGLERLLQCGLSAAEAREVLESLVETLRSIPAAARAPLVSSGSCCGPAGGCVHQQVALARCSLG